MHQIIYQTIHLTTLPIIHSTTLSTIHSTTLPNHTYDNLFLQCIQQPSKPYIRKPFLTVHSTILSNHTFDNLSKLYIRLAFQPLNNSSIRSYMHAPNHPSIKPYNPGIDPSTHPQIYPKSNQKFTHPSIHFSINATISLLAV